MCFPSRLFVPTLQKISDFTPKYIKGLPSITPTSLVQKGKALESLSVKNKREFSSKVHTSAASLTSEEYRHSKQDSLTSLLDAEYHQEKEAYVSLDNLKNEIQKLGWSVESQPGSIQTIMKKLHNGLFVRIEFNLTRAAYGQMNEQFEEISSYGITSKLFNSFYHTVTNFTIACEKSQGTQGIIFYCTTLDNHEKQRFLIGNIRYYGTEDEKRCATAYGGPLFNDLSYNIKCALLKWLESVGIDSKLCDFIDCQAIHREQEEYMRWLHSVAAIAQQ